jgi:hypothetical protein
VQLYCNLCSCKHNIYYIIWYCEIKAKNGLNNTTRKQSLQLKKLVLLLLLCCGLVGRFQPARNRMFKFFFVTEFHFHSVLCHRCPSPSHRNRPTVSDSFSIASRMESYLSATVQSPRRLGNIRGTTLPKKAAERSLAAPFPFSILCSPPESPPVVSMPKEDAIVLDLAR